MHCNVTFVQETSEFFRTNNQWLCTCTAPQHVLQLQRFSHPSVLELRIDFACYENRYINNFSTKLTTNLYYYAARSFMKGSGASFRGNMNWPFILNPYLWVGCAGTFFKIIREPYVVLPWSLLYTGTEMCASNRCILSSVDTYVVTGCFCIYELNMQLSWPCL